jgi:flavin-dependent dehydrogenase
MNVAIAGAGIAGGYLAALLARDGIEADVFDPMAHGTRCGCRSCGWGAPAGIEKYLDAIDLDPADFVLEEMAVMHFDGLTATTPLVTIDKPRLLRGVSKDIPIKKQILSTEEASQYDLVVDATGVARALLPPCRSDLILPTLQHRVAVEPCGDDRLEAGVYGNDVPGLGYLWVFPVGDGEFHVGVGGIGLASLEDLMARFYREQAERFSFTRRCVCQGSIRVASPHWSTPFHAGPVDGEGGSPLVVGVGESIGTVAPFTGEGIAYSLECATLLAGRLDDPVGYARAVLSRFGWMKRERDTLDFLLARRETTWPRLRDRWRFYRNARRSGITLPWIEAFRRMGSLSRWVESPHR